MENQTNEILPLLWSIVGGVAAVLVALITWAITIGRKFQAVDDLKRAFGAIEHDLKDLLARVSKIEGRIFGIAIPGSPLKLTPLGLDIIHESGILRIIRARKTTLLEKIKAQNPPTAYDVQEMTKSIFGRELDLNPREETGLKDYAFQKGITLQEVLMAGALYFRDVALEELGLTTDAGEATPEYVNQFVENGF